MPGPGPESSESSESDLVNSFEFTAMGSRQTEKELAGNLTQVVIQTFSDRTLVLVTQLGKVGNLVNPSFSLRQSTKC